MKPIYDLLKIADSGLLMKSYWDLLSPKEKIDLLLEAPPPIPVRCSVIGLEDVNPMVRAIAITKSRFARYSSSFKKIREAETSPLPTAAYATHFHIDEALDMLPQDLRIPMLSLRQDESVGEFIPYLKQGLESGGLSPRDAAELLVTFFRNPHLVRWAKEAIDGPEGLYKRYGPEGPRKGYTNGLFWSSFWEFAKTAPDEVFTVVIDHLVPLAHSDLPVIPWQEFEKDRQRFVSLVGRLLTHGYRPVIEAIKAEPKRFGKTLVDRALGTVSG